MEKNNQTTNQSNKHVNLDSGISAQNLQLIKQSLPLLDFSAQKQITVLLKIIELKNTIRNFQEPNYTPNWDGFNTESEKAATSNVVQFNQQAAPPPFSNFMNSNSTNYSSNNLSNPSSNNMLNNMMMFMNMMNNNSTSSNLSAADLSSQAQRPPDINNFVSKFKQTMTEDQRNMLNSFNTMMQSNSMQERNSVRNDDV